VYSVYMDIDVVAVSIKNISKENVKVSPLVDYEFWGLELILIVAAYLQLIFICFFIFST